ncbi:type II toxin-antitoxin system VapC family toxin [Pseudonocardia acaciae]|uniref:type II toxin-antitoxin system VapC family toxin n=1 Tax=Pseudonocardia acaciae TaxID=551276 RepID=UPI000490E024|nr:type II toxin-antitoxin system VapC family toxin [Pseudonocardia acaciae]
MARVILDTGVLIEVGRRRLGLSALSAQDDIALPAVVLAEYLAGLQIDPDPDRRARGRAELERIRAVAPIEDYTAKVAPHHADLLAHTRRTGRPRGPHDLIIAATARATDRVLLTTDRKAAFEDLPGVQVRAL